MPCRSLGICTVLSIGASSFQQHAMCANAFECDGQICRHISHQVKTFSLRTFCLYLTEAPSPERGVGVGWGGGGLKKAERTRQGNVLIVSSDRFGKIAPTSVDSTVLGR